MRKASRFIVLGGVLLVLLLVAGAALAASPVTQDDSYTTAEGRALSVSAIDGVLHNDSDSDGQPLKATTYSGWVGTGIAVDLEPDGSFELTPDDGYSGDTGFTYQAGDPDGNWTYGSASVTVLESSPVAGPDSYGTPEGRTLVVSAAEGVLANDDDPLNHDLVASLDIPSVGSGIDSLALNADGSFTLVPESGYSGDTGFNYRAVDPDGNWTLAGVTIHIVESTPVAGVDSYGTPEGRSLTVSATDGVLANDDDPFKHALIASLDIPSVGPGIDSLALNADGSFTLKPHSGYSGDTRFNYRAVDPDGNWDLTRADIHVLESSPITVGDSYGMIQGQTLTVAASSGVLANDDDPLNHDLVASLDIPSVGSGIDSLALNADGSFTLVPNHAFHGATSFNYVAEDPDGNGTLGHVSITVKENTPPVAVHVVAKDGHEDMPYELWLPATDADNDPLQFFIVSGPAHGTLTPVSTGVYTYMPEKDWSGIDTFTWKANDGHSDSNIVAMDVQVAPVNDPPGCSVDPVEQTVQYSDPTAQLTVLEHDIDGPEFHWWEMALPSDVHYVSGSITTGTDPVTHQSIAPYFLSRYFQGLMWEPAGDYPVTFSVGDSLEVRSATTTYHVTREDAMVTSLVAPVAIQVGSGGVASATISGAIAQAADGHPGDITKATVRVALTAVGPGASYARVVGVAPDGSFSAGFIGLPANCYAITAVVGGSYFVSPPSDEELLTVYNPTAGFATGGGWFYWPGTTDKTSFGFVTNYGRKGVGVKGSFVVIRHGANGNHRLKSNALLGMAVGQVGGASPYGWCSFSGKATYAAPQGDPIGGHTFQLYAEDRNQPGAGVDRLWIKVKTKAGAIVVPLSMGTPAATMALPLDGGNIAIPHRAQ